MRHVFIINPKAGKKDKSEEIIRKIRLAAQDKKINPAIHITERPKHAIKLVTDELAQHPGQPVRFYACGGDGTLNEVVSAAAGHEHASVTHYPAGTGNDFVKTFGG